MICMKQKLDFNLDQFQIFDSHCHPSLDLRDFEANLNNFKIKQFCFMPTVIENDFNDLRGYFRRINPIVNKFKKFCLVFGALDFAKSPEKNRILIEEQKIKEDIKGIKFHYEQNFTLDRDYLVPYFKVIEDVFGFDIPIYIHTDWPLKGERLEPTKLKDSFSKFPEFFPEHKYIAGHAGCSGAYLSVWKVCKKFSNVFVETSMCPTTPTLEEIVWKVGSDRILFGSNYPYCATSVEVVKILSMYKVTDEDRENIFYNNAEVLFSL